LNSVELHGGGLDFDVLIGMDVISKGDLNVRADGSFSFAF
jgi:hypothetical protein